MANEPAPADPGHLAQSPHPHHFFLCFSHKSAACSLGLSVEDSAGRASSGIGNWEGQASAMQVFVRDNDINSALRVLKRKMQREGLFRELRRRRAYEKPSERRARERAEGGRRRRKALTKRMLREGY